jgi:hypothetical protein
VVPEYGFVEMLKMYFFVPAQIELTGAKHSHGVPVEQYYR